MPQINLPGGKLLNAPEGSTPEDLSEFVKSYLEANPDVGAEAAPKPETAPEGPGFLRRTADSLGFGKLADIGGAAVGAAERAGEAGWGEAQEVAGPALKAVARNAMGMNTGRPSGDYWSHIGEAMAKPWGNPVPSQKAISEAERVATTLGQAVTEPAGTLAANVLPWGLGDVENSVNEYAAQHMAPFAADVGMYSAGTAVNALGMGADALTGAVAAAVAGPADPKAERGIKEGLDVAQMAAGVGDVVQAARGASGVARAAGDAAGANAAAPLTPLAQAAVDRAVNPALAKLRETAKNLVSYDEGKAAEAKVTLDRYDADVEAKAKAANPNWDKLDDKTKAAEIKKAKSQVLTPNMNPTTFTPGWIGLGRVYAELDAMGLSATSKTAFDKIEDTLRGALKETGAPDDAVEAAVTQLKNRVAGGTRPATEALQQAHENATSATESRLLGEHASERKNLEEDVELTQDEVLEHTSKAVDELKTAVLRADPGRVYEETVHLTEAAKSGIQNYHHTEYYAPARAMAESTGVERPTEGVNPTLAKEGLITPGLSKALANPLIEKTVRKLKAAKKVGFSELHDLRTRLNDIIGDGAIRPDLDRGKAMQLRNVVDDLLTSNVPPEWEPAVAKLKAGDVSYGAQIKQFNESALDIMHKNIQAGTAPDPWKATELLNEPGMGERRRQILATLDKGVHPKASDRVKGRIPKTANTENFRARFLSATIRRALSDSQIYGAEHLPGHLALDTDKLLQILGRLREDGVLEDYAGKEGADRIYEAGLRLSYAKGKSATIDMSHDRPFTEAVKMAEDAQARLKEHNSERWEQTVQRLRKEAAANNPLSNTGLSESVHAAVDMLLSPKNEVKALHTLTYLDKHDPAAASLLRQEATRRVFESFFNSRKNKPDNVQAAHDLNLKNMPAGLVAKLWPGTGKDILELAKHVARIMGPEGAGMPSLAAGSIMDLPPIAFDRLGKAIHHPSLGNVFKFVWGSRLTRVWAMESIVKLTMNPRFVRWILDEWKVGGANAQGADALVRKGVSDAVTAGIRALPTHAATTLFGMPGASSDPFAAIAPETPDFDSGGDVDLDTVFAESRARRSQQ